jgi:hypothetical protein
MDASSPLDQTGAVNEPPADHPTRPHQPYLFDLVSCVKAPSVVLSAPDGQIDEGGVQGWLYADRRLLSRLRITVNGSAPVGLSDEVRGAAGAVFRAVVPQVGAPTNDPTFFVERHREVGHDRLVETLADAGQHVRRHASMMREQSSRVVARAWRCGRRDLRQTWRRTPYVDRARLRACRRDVSPA